MTMRGGWMLWNALALAIAACVVTGAVMAASSASAKAEPWMNAALSPDVRADLVVQQMTLAEKVQLVHGVGWAALIPGHPIPRSLDYNFGAGYVPGIKRLGIPAINLSDSAVGVRLAAIQSRYATLLPSVVGLASSWNPQAALLYGAVLGRELRDQGFDMSIGGGINLTREPRDGRTFEFAGEDPLLAGTTVGNVIKGIESHHVMGDIKHYALNDQETGRTGMHGAAGFNAVISRRAAHESDLLAFQIALGIGHPSAVMCAYNRVNGVAACQNKWLLDDVLKHEFGFKGWVVSDWGGTHSTVASALAGLDMEMPGDTYYGAPLQTAVESGKIPLARLDNMDQRILRSLFAAGVVDHPVLPRTVVNPFRGRRDAEHIAEQSMVLLKNAGPVLPLDAASIRSIALIGSHADVGVLSGGGSAQVDPPGGDAVDPHAGTSHWQEVVYFPSSPLRNIRRRAPHATVAFNAGTDIASAVALARNSRVAIVFVNQPMREGMDRPTLALPDNQDELIEAVAAANPHTIVVLETGGPVTMPWLAKVQGVIEAWYPGIGGAQALTHLLFGDVDFSGRLAVTFPQSDAQLPHPHVTGLTPAVFAHESAGTSAIVAQPFDVDYNVAGAAVGYKWFELKHLTPLFPFGYGLAYTTYAFADLKVAADGASATLTVTNVGKRMGTAVAEVYARLPKVAGEAYPRLVGFERIALAPGASRSVTIPLNPLCMSIWDSQTHRMLRLPGTYTVSAGPSAAATALSATFTLAR